MRIFPRNQQRWLILAVVSFSVPAWALEQVDLGVGSAIPSNNSSILENPAALGKFKEKVFDFSGQFNSGGSPDFLGSFSSGLGGFGFGIDVKRITNDFSAAAAFGASTKSFAMGVSAQFLFSNLAPRFSLGILQEFKSFSLAFLLRDLANFGKIWSLGFGVSPGKTFRIGFDFDFQSSVPIIGISQATVVAIAELYATQKYAFRLNYSLPIIPNIIFNLSYFGAGFHYWVSKKVGFYASYNDYYFSSTYMLGAKFSL